MNSHYRAKDDLFLNIADELEVFIYLKAHKAIVWLYKLLF